MTTKYNSLLLYKSVIEKWISIGHFSKNIFTGKPDEKMVMVE